MNEEQLQNHVISGITRNVFRCPAAALTCADGLILSVQASESHYCEPRSNSGPYLTVEVGFPSLIVEEFLPYADDPENPTGTVYRRVPVQTVLSVINVHGGIKS